MAAIGKIRSWGPTLAIVIGLALFAFIAEEAFRSCEATNNERRQQVGEVLGKKISVQEFQDLVDEYQDAIKMTQNRENLSEEELNQVKNQVWQILVNNTIVESEAKKLGLNVTDEEIQNILKQGTNPILSQTPFVNQQTGLFDVTQLTQFLNEYNKLASQPQNAQLVEQYQKIYNYWKFIEKTLRQNVLSNKYQNLLFHCLISNPVSAKSTFDNKNQESEIQLATIPYSSIKDAEVEVTDKDLKEQYNKQKELYKWIVESRDIKYVDFKVLPSQADKAALMKTMNEAQQKLDNGANPEEVVRKAQSQILYVGMPLSRNAFPSDIAAKLDSMQVGQTTMPFESKYDNTYNVIKLLAKYQLPDSVEFRQIQVGGVTVDAARKTADSVYTALKAGGDFEAIAKKYGQDGKKQWITSAMFEHSQSIDADSKSYIQAIQNSNVDDIQNLQFSQGNVIFQVTARKAMVSKYDAAVVKHTIDFSKNTYSDAYNKFSQFVSENKDIESLEKNAEKYGYKVQERTDVYNSEHYVAGIRSTRAALKWIFDAKKGDVSPLYECGNNDHLLVVALTKIHPVGYRDLDDVKDVLKLQVINEKKFVKAQEKLNGVKNIAGAKQRGAQISEVPMITFGAPVFVSATGTTEPALSGAVAATKQGKFCPNVIKGDGGAYMFQVTKKTKRADKFDEKSTEAELQQNAISAASRYLYELYLKAKVVDNRYLFF